MGRVGRSRVGHAKPDATWVEGEAHKKYRATTFLHFAELRARHMSLSQEAGSVAELHRLVAADDSLLAAVHRHRGGESLDDVLLRFTRARPKSTAKALAMLSADIEDREQNSTLELAASPGASVLGGKAMAAQYCKHCPHGYLGHDRQGRPVLYKNFSSCRLWELQAEGVDVETCLRYNKWVTERTAHLMRHTGQWTIILDLEGLTLRQCTSPVHMKYCKGLAKDDSNHYPERLAHMLIINAPALFSKTWSLVASWLDDATRNKVRIVAHQWREELTEVLDLSIMPKHLGGATGLDAARAALEPPAVPIVAPGEDAAGAPAVDSRAEGELADPGLEAAEPEPLKSEPRVEAERKASDPELAAETEPLNSESSAEAELKASAPGLEAAEPEPLNYDGD